MLSCDNFALTAAITSLGSNLHAKNSDRPVGEAQGLRFYPAAEHPEGAMLQCTDLTIPQVRHTYELLPQWAKHSWRWRILYLRAKLDVLRFERSYQLSGQLRPGASWTEVLRGCEEAKVAMQELVQIYHSNMHADDKMHPMFRCVRPALKEL